MSKSQGTGIVLLVVPQHLGANNAVKPTAYGGGLPWPLDFWAARILLPKGLHLRSKK